MKPLLLASVMTWGLCSFAAAAELPRADPASVGLDGRQLDAITALLKKDVADHVLPGAVLLIVRHGKVAYEQAVGSRDPQNGADEGGRYLPHLLHEQADHRGRGPHPGGGRQACNSDDPVPNTCRGSRPCRSACRALNRPMACASSPAERPITVQDLMRHSSGLTYGFFGDTPVKKAYQQAHLEADNPDLATFVDRLAKQPLGYQPGTTWDYSYASTCWAASLR